ncbi:GNAT family N-acetyltransferase [Rhizobium lentis]|uniref:GNAT family N-acetyltransferase n=1 Tax=Rhizobium TaxID=379 RepID=UPI001C8318D2|nr:GNAT family N-acetyltransferase [Rhizobium lentis]MBX5131161.1 GNAT family N-acetyltransferase [Rhizobium lentis]MBX5137277.1 GNAT family N-acetyltransferase [Rhizobium lentis]MBX5149470.1 GNAT family N-acetyltransferase [Rhizobium lentis]MBX5178791.1 GNAT family N-acetyltransferase [Rhizobium lentis]
MRPVPDQDFTIRSAAPDDLEGLTVLYRHLNPTDPILDGTMAEERFSAILAQPGMTIFIGFAGAHAAATVTLIIVPNLTRGGASYALIENVVTHAEHRRRGYANAVIGHAVNEAWKAGCYKVMLLTGSKNPATLRFYENCGFLQDKTGYQIRRP